MKIPAQDLVPGNKHFILTFYRGNDIINKKWWGAILKANIPGRYKTQTELEKTFQKKIKYLSEQINLATQKPIRSEMREEYANQIAVVLRALVTYTTSCESLAKRCDYDKKMYFPLYDPVAAQNLLPQYNLVQMSWNNSEKTGTFCVNDDLDDKDKVRCTYMTFENWKNESVVDFHSDDFSPLSRESIIRIVADKLGAHVDSKIEEILYKVENDNISPIQLVQDGVSYYVDGRNLFTETIIGIAKELVFAYSYTIWENLESSGQPESNVYIQEYKGAKKFTVSKIEINAYNANIFLNAQLAKFPSIDFLSGLDLDFLI